MTGSVASVKGFSRFRCVFVEEGGIALIRPHVAQRTEGQEYPAEPAESRSDGHIGFPTSRQETWGMFEFLILMGKIGRPVLN